MTSSPWPKPTSRILPCHQLSTGWPPYCWTSKFVAASPAGSGWNQIRLPAWSVIIGPGVPFPW